eukprot:7837531-Pyramimonas_sp.AAC.1
MHGRIRSHAASANLARLARARSAAMGTPDLSLGGPEATAEKAATSTSHLRTLRAPCGRRSAC